MTATPMDTLDGIDTALVNHALILNRIYTQRSAGDHTFNGVLHDFISEIETHTGAFKNRDLVHGIIKSRAAELETIYNNRTAGDHTWLGALAAFLINVQTTQ